MAYNKWKSRMSSNCFNSKWLWLTLLLWRTTPSEDLPRGSLLVGQGAWCLSSQRHLIRQALLTPNHSRLCVLLEGGGPVLLLLPLACLLIHSPRRPSLLHACFPGRESPVATAQHCGCPLLCALPWVNCLWSEEWWRRGVQRGMARGWKAVIPTGQVYREWGVVGDEGWSILLGDGDGDRGQRELCVWLATTLAVLELNQGFNFILYQLKNKGPIVSFNSSVTHMTRHDKMKDQIWTLLGTSLTCIWHWYCSCWARICSWYCFSTSWKRCNHLPCWRKDKHRPLSTRGLHYNTRRHTL